MSKTRERLFGPVIGWTVATTLFTLLPLIRIAGRAEGYEWRVLGLSGSGTTGPFLVFVPALAYALVLLWGAHRGPRALFRPMLVVWHAAVTAIVIAATAGGGTIQGQGLRWEIPAWVIAIPCAVFAALAVWWVVLDARHGGRPTDVPWTRRNTRRLLGALLLGCAAFVLFRLGTNYNWVTAVAVVTTILFWIQLFESTEPLPAESQPEAGTRETGEPVA